MHSQEFYETFITNLTDQFNLLKFLDGLDIGAYIVDKSRVIVYWNKMAQELTGYPREEVVGKSCKDNILMHTDSMGVPICKTELCPLIRALKTEKSAFVPFAVYAKVKNSTKRIPFNVFTFPIAIEGLPYSGIEFFSISHEAQDLVRAMNIQKSLLPSNLPDFIKVFYHPSNFLSGDMIFFEDPFFGLIDVSGHGISSSLISTALRLIIKELVNDGVPLEAFGSEIERRYSLFHITEKYFTGIFGKVKEENKLSLVSFGHPSPLKILSDGSIQELSLEQDTPIGFDFQHVTQQKEVTLHKGESILLYSDGIVEIKTKDGFLDTSGLIDVLKTEKDLEKVYTKCMEMNVEQFQ
ncbi:MAG: SpoIIE family protein phosphatase, partial [Thermotogota bacterium]